MKEFKQKYHSRRRLYSLPVVILLGMVVLFIGHGVFGMYQKVRVSDSLLKKEKRQLSDLEQRALQIDKEIEYATSQTGKEEYMRREFNLARSGESVIVVLDEEKKEEAETKKIGVWQRFLNIFK